MNGETTSISATAPAHAVGRLHSMDALRATAMLLGVVEHAGIAYMARPRFGWAVDDASKSAFIDALIFCIHGFRMQAFFLIAGFFACMLLRRRGRAGFVVHRVKRVLVPFVVSCVILVPTLQFAWVLGHHHLSPGQMRAFRLARDAELPFTESMAGFFGKGHFLHPPGFRLFHLWFLLYLIVLYALALGAVWIARRAAIKPFLDRLLRRILTSPGKAALLALPTWALMLAVWNPDGMPAFGKVFIEWRVMLYYGFFFAVGWILFDQLDLLRALGAGWKWSLVLALAVFLPILLIWRDGLPYAAERIDFWRRAAYQAAYALFTWLMALGLIGFFLERCSAESRVARYISDASYWVYLIHLTPVVLLQYLLKDAPWPWPFKFGIVLGLTTAAAFLTYEFFVRYTLIGATLNGPKRRSAKAGKGKEVTRGA